jgi:ribosome-associated protein
LTDKQTDSPPTPYLKKALFAAQSAIDKQGYAPALIDLTTVQSYTDYLLIVSAPGPRAVQAIADHVELTMDEAGYRPLGIEGVSEGRWALLDYGELVIHIFDQPLREFYDLEGMWFDAPRLPLVVPPEQQQPPRTGYDYSDEQDGGRRSYSSSSSSSSL